MDGLEQKLEKLKSCLTELGSVAIAFSGGVDSSFLLKVSADTLGKDNVLALTVFSDFISQKEQEEAKNFCLEQQIKHLTLPVDILKIEGIAQNPKNRCYLCKYALFSEMKKIAYENKISYVCEGSNVDDLSDYRPGLKAIEELNIQSPLQSAQLTKQDIRDLSLKMGLPTWNKPSLACLASRFVYGENITFKKLKMVEEAEQFLFTLGLKQMRVRLHEKLARIEVLPEDFEKIIQNKNAINQKFQDLGFCYITLDLQGFRSGSMNETIFKKD